MSVDSLIYGREIKKITDTLVYVREPDKEFILCNNSNVCELNGRKILDAYGDSVVLKDRDKTIVTNIRNCKILNVDDKLQGCANGYFIIEHPMKMELLIYNKELEKVYMLNWSSVETKVYNGKVNTDTKESIIIQGDIGMIQLVIDKITGRVETQRI